MFYGHNGIKVASINRKVIGKSLHTLKLNKILLNNPHRKEQVLWSLKYIELHENKNTQYQILWDTAKAVLRDKFIPLNAQIRKEETSQSNISKQKSKLPPQEFRKIMK